MPPPCASRSPSNRPTHSSRRREQPAGELLGTPSGDVPGRVARLNDFDGTVTFEPAGGTDWAYAELNRPMTTGDQIWVDNGGRSELHIGSTALRLGQSSALSIVNLDDENAQLKLAQGTLETRLLSMPAGQTFEVDTPNLALQADGPGVYRVDAAPRRHIDHGNGPRGERYCLRRLGIGPDRRRSAGHLLGHPAPGNRRRVCPAAGRLRDVGRLARPDRRRIGVRAVRVARRARL
ncbi:MAG: hypothetical protein WDN30_05690 [Pararobbsia sp.]